MIEIRKITEEEHLLILIKRSEKQWSNKASSSYCKLCKKNNHDTNDCRYKCKKCKRHLHYEKDYFYRQKEEANFLENKEYLDHTLYSALSSQEPRDVWYVDSGCSNHMTKNKSCFVQLDETIKSKVTLGDGNVQTIEGKGTIAVKTQNGSQKYIHDVFYVSGLTQNLLSVGQLIHKNYKVIFDDDKCNIIDKRKGQIISIQMAPNKVFPLFMPFGQNNALKCENMDESILWHLRYGHLNFNGLKLLKQKNMVLGLPFISSNLKVCEGCIYGKMHRLPFPKTSWRAKAPLQLVLADIWGPSSTPNFGGRRYFLLFVDDYTRMMWVYFIQQKSDAFSCFKEFKALVEKQSGHSLKILRTDRGGEFNGLIFINFCNDHGIKKELTVRHTPQ